MSSDDNDHLNMSSRKQELSLTLTPTPFKSMFLDETPTPTRFLNALENEIYQELGSDNPFDATFRRANSRGGAHSLNIPESSSLIASLPDSEVLNTPSITLPAEPETPLILKKCFSQKKDDERSCQTTNENTTDTLPFSPEQKDHADVTTQNASDTDLSMEESNFATLDPNRFINKTSATLKINAVKTTVVQTPVITSTGNSTIMKSNGAGVPTAVVVTRPTNIIRNLAPAQPVVAEKTSQVKVPEQPQAVVQSVCVTPMVQVMIRLPDGQTMPVQFPVMASAPAVAVPAPVTTVPVATSVPVTSSIPTQNPVVSSIVAPVSQIIQTSVASTESEVPTSSTAKLKLKHVLTMNQKTGSKRSSGTKTQLLSKATNEPLIHETLLAELGITPPSSPTELMKLDQGRKRREPVDDPDEKRRRSLERNRAAATRCREKRKQWINALERKADELATTNSHLQHEVAQLRTEVAHLKSMLLAHKDCPVTLQQRMNYESEKDAYTTVHIINTSPEDLQRVPNSSVVSPLNTSEYMEVDINSVQSTSDSSLTSDMSEASFKER
ncbi:cyclic AMP-dependent transcription factor ATF-2-like [Argiope bruennichi]|uniref:cyclic AMP-dependent transcription factor ATF-2-like n=1 Tax=Argiope bruennichi TaxID=94029 RepID=UPI002495A706|nr:cyclic AMP-dependent transcription factor ATF-2-like [Argiope bruennichi]XP_055925156.1 cyclic AMP-dependent transcription factor ATF-2-like [Argiope bruennichi]